jgi:hypothetical protein
MAAPVLVGGFFNSVGSDRLYDASDFSRYLEGIIDNGCFPNDSGFAPVATLKVIGEDPPSIVISPGKVYLNGMWAVNDEDLEFYLGETVQITENLHHLVYFCFDTNDNARTVTIECLTSTVANTPPTLPVDGAGKYYLPLALVADQRNVQPSQIHITDRRESAGVTSISVPTESIEDEAVTEAKIDNLAVTAGKIAWGAVSLPRLATTGFLFFKRLDSNTSITGVSSTPKVVTGFLVTITPLVNCYAKVAVTGQFDHSNDADYPTVYMGLFQGINGATPTEVNNTFLGSTRERASETSQVGIANNQVLQLTAGTTYVIQVAIKSATAGTVIVLAPSTITATLYPR